MTTKQIKVGDMTLDFKLSKKGKVLNPIEFDKLCLYFKPRLNRMARTTCTKFGLIAKAVEPEDLMQELYTVLYTSLVKFDPNAGTQFNTYAFSSCQNRLFNIVRDLTHIREYNKYKDHPEKSWIARNLEAVNHAVTVSEYELETGLKFDTMDTKSVSIEVPPLVRKVKLKSRRGSNRW